MWRVCVCVDEHTGMYIIYMIHITRAMRVKAGGGASPVALGRLARQRIRLRRDDVQNAGAARAPGRRRRRRPREHARQASDDFVLSVKG